jgi:prepilin-type N-terminal cleavage/methylation domain-containing protein
MNMKKACLSGRQGFSLLELMVVIGMIGILTGISLTSLTSSRKKKAVETDARKVTAVIREAQNNAFSGKKADICSTWTVYYDNGTSDFRLVGSPLASCTGQIYQYRLDSNIIFQGSGTGSISFIIPFGNISFSSNKIILCSNSDSTNCYTICVNSAGKIEEREGDAECS